MAKVAKIWDGTAWVDLATSVPDLSNYQLKSESGLTFVKKQTIGTAVSSVTVSDAFSATYENYRIIVSGGTSSSAGPLHLQLGATTSGYRFSAIYNQTSATTPLGLGSESGSFFSDFGRTAATNGFSGMCDLFSPNRAISTGIRYASFDPASSGGYNINGQGVMPTATQYTDFTVISAGGNLTGGTIYVYGYNKG